jgi:hypothetical protein
MHATNLNFEDVGVVALKLVLERLGLGQTHLAGVALGACV